MSARTWLDRSEGGFTLPEMLMAIAVMAIVVVPLANSMVIGLRTSDRTASVLVTSADRQLLSNYLPPDAMSASAATDNPGPTGCPSPEGERVVLLTWSEYTGTLPVTSYASDYRLVGLDTPKRLVRYRCEAGVGAEIVTVAHDAVNAVPTLTPGTVAVTVTDSLGAQYTVSGSRRAA